MAIRCIYKIINVRNGKFYVGSAVDFSKRKARHKWKLNRGDHANKHLQAAWNKHGPKAFVFCIVQEIPEGEDLLEWENKWLHEHVGKDYCYNIAKDATAFGRGTFGPLNPMYGKTFKHTDEAKEKIGNAQRGKKMSDEAKNKIRTALKGHTHSTETREKISESLKGEGNYWYGKARPEFAEKVRKAVFCTGNGVTYPSVRHAREALGMTPPTLNRALKSGQPISKGKFEGWAFRYVEKDHAAQERNLVQGNRTEHKD